MADYSRPASGFRFKPGGMKVNSPPDGIPTEKSPYLQNVRETLDTAWQTRPGLQQVFDTGANTPVTDISSYTALGTDSNPRYLARTANGNLYLDNGVNVGGATGDTAPGVKMIPFRPAQSTDPFMYVAHGNGYLKYSPPSATNVVTFSNTGIAEPQTPPQPVLGTHIVSGIGLPSQAAPFTSGGNAGTVATGNRLQDTVQGVFADPLPNSFQKTIQVTAGASLPAGVYLNGAVQTYFFDKSADPQGAYRDVFPVNVTSAAAAATGNSLLWNPSQITGSTDANVHPMVWATIDANGNIIGSTHPYPGDHGQSYYMVVITQLFVPVAGNYNIQINHDDGLIFAIAGASLVSGAVNDPFHHTQTGVNGYTFTNGTIAGTNGQGYHPETFVVNFPNAGVYAMEIDYAQFKDNQTLIVLANSNNIHAAGAANAYQRFMDVIIGGRTMTVVDVFPPLPQAIGISSIFYLSGLGSGLCVVVPKVLGQSQGTQGQSLYDEVYLSSIRRGSLVKIGNEVCYVLGTSIGPDGSIAFETSTASTHFATESLFGVPAISVTTPSGVVATIGDTITSPDTEFSVTAGIGTITLDLPNNPFINSSSSFQNEDYIHMSMRVSNLKSLNEIKLLFDVGDGTFRSNFYFFTIRPSDVQAGIDNDLTQLGVAQVVSQRATIDEEQAATAKNQGVTSSSAQTAPGDNQWSEIQFQISDLTRVGNDQTLSLQNVNSVQVLVNAQSAASIAINSIHVYGGFAPDVGDNGAPYQYRIRPRSSATGVIGNPSPVARYSISPRRTQVTVILPSSAYDPQIDTWDIFRYGGTQTSWRFIGSIPSFFTSFNDNFSDDTASAGQVLEFDNYEPWPSIDIPLTNIFTNVQGHYLIVTLPSPATNKIDYRRYLPGNIIQLGTGTGSSPTISYTLYTRPILLSGSTVFLFQLVENAGFRTITTMRIYEPLGARQVVPYMWGPDSDGNIYAVGDPLRLGTFYFSKSNAPDATSDKFNQELTSPSEPLLGGEVIDGLSYVASSQGWWALYPTGNALQRYKTIKQNIPRGLASPFGIVSDGKDIYFVAQDGIWSIKQGSLTDDDLYNLFPHEGVAGEVVTYRGRTIQPPDYSKAAAFRLAKVNNYLYFTYVDSSTTYRQLVYNVVTKAWRVDKYSTPISTVYHPAQPEGKLLTTTGTVTYPTAVMGTMTGKVARQQDNTNDLGQPIACVVNTVEWDGGDFRAGKQWGDIYADIQPTSSVSLTPVSAGAPAAGTQIIAAGSARKQVEVSLGGGALQTFLGLEASWTDDFSTQSTPTKVYGWQPSWITKQEATTDRFSDWLPVQSEGKAGFVQGLILRADTFNIVKSIKVRDSDTQTLHSLTPAIQHNGESTRAYSFNPPFSAHLVRIEPQDLIPWRLFEAVWVAEPTPEFAETWVTQPTAFAMNGYSHIYRIMAAYAASAPVTLTITAQDGQSPAPLILPATGGAYVKTQFVLTANKGLLYTFSGQSATPFQFWLDDFEILVGNWGRTGGYLTWKNLGGRRGDQVRI